LGFLKGNRGRNWKGRGLLDSFPRRPKGVGATLKMSRRRRLIRAEEASGKKIRRRGEEVKLKQQGAVGLMFATRRE